MAQHQMAQSDAALNAFDRLRLREVMDMRESTVSLLAKFQSTAASLEPDERITLKVNCASEDIEVLKTVLADPQASKICVLYWAYIGEEDASSVVPLLASNCPELAMLQVHFRHHSLFDFVSSVLEHPNSKIKVLAMSDSPGGNLPRFFAALEQSQVSAINFFSCFSPGFFQGLCEYLTKDLLMRLKVSTENRQGLFQTIVSLANCTRLVELELHGELSEPTAFAHLPKSITKLKLDGCMFASDFDWSFLADRNVRELGFYSTRGVDGNLLGSALAVHLSAKGLDRLYFFRCVFVNETLAAVGAKIGQVKKLEFGSNLNNASFELIAITLRSPNNELRELVLEYDDDTMSGIENHLAPALRHSNCHLVQLRLEACYLEHIEAAKKVEHPFHYRRALFLLLQGQQVRRKVPCPLRRLPVEMFRLVGEVLM